MIMASCVKEMPALTQLSPISFLSSLHRCRTEKNLALALRLHDACMHNQQFLIAHPSLGDQLLSVLVEFGNMAHAQQLFDMLIACKSSSLDVLISGYVKHGELHNALSLYKKMQEDYAIHLSGSSYVMLLKGCGVLQEVGIGCSLHKEVAKLGLLEQDIFVGSALVEMYIKLGFLDKAQKVFDRLQAVDVVSWTVLIAGYVEHGFGEKAFCCYERMQATGISPDALTLACTLRACGSICEATKGMEVHLEILKKGLQENPLVGNALIDMYAKCGLLDMALQVFDNLQVKDVVSWNALIAGYTQCGYGERALHVFNQMQCEGTPSDNVTFVHCLKSCCMTENHLKGREIHTEIVQKGFETEALVSSTLVNMYAKGGFLADACVLFDVIASPSEVLCNALMTGYMEHKSSEEALHFFESMQNEGRPLSTVTFVLGLKSCGSAGVVSKGRKMHAHVVWTGIEVDLLVGGTIVDMYCKCGALTEAQSVFDRLPVQDVVSWTALMAGYSDHGHDEEVLDCYEQMQQNCVPLNAVTYACILKTCGNIGATERGLRSHVEITYKGLDCELLVGNILVEMYAKGGWLTIAQSVFDGLPFHDSIAYNALILGYLEQGAGEKALMCLERLQLENMYMNTPIMVCCLRACGITGSTSKGQWLHLEIVKRGLHEELLIGNTLIDTYAKCGLLKDAHSLFLKIPAPSVVSWTALMSGYAHLGECEMVFNILNGMIKDGVMPNLVTCVSVLNACNHAGLVSEGCLFLKSMSCELGFIPTVEHYTCMVDMLGRMGHTDKAILILLKMPMQPDILSWQKVLGACSKWGDVELGRHAFDHSVRMDKTDTAAYVYMHNIIAADARGQHSGS